MKDVQRQLGIIRLAVIKYRQSGMWGTGGHRSGQVSLDTSGFRDCHTCPPSVAGCLQKSSKSAGTGGFKTRLKPGSGL